MTTGRILIIGCASLDTIHLESAPLADSANSASLAGLSERRTFNTFGGAGLYTALAAAHISRSQDKTVTLLAPRPLTLPVGLVFVEQQLLWPGPIVAPHADLVCDAHSGSESAGLPTLEIVHHGGGRAMLVGASWGAEQVMGADREELADLLSESSFDFVHLAALSSPAHQLALAKKLIQTSGAKISAGTYARAISSDAASVAELMAVSDYFFMNSNEANMLLAGKPEPSDRVVVITDGADGAVIYAQGQVLPIDAVAVQELDPTGAGDTFCGAMLAAVASGAPLLEAGQGAAKLASQVIGQPGCEFYRTV